MGSEVCVSVLSVIDTVAAEQAVSGRTGKLSTFFVQVIIWSILACAAQRAQHSVVVTESGLGFGPGAAVLLW